MKSGVRNISLPTDKKTPEAAATLTAEEVAVLVNAPAKKTAARKTVRTKK